MIPILTKGIQELQFENNALQNQIDQLSITNNEMQDQIQQLMIAVDACCSQPSPSQRLSGGQDEQASQLKQTQVVLEDSRSVVLDQNVPNPFAERTTITYLIPANTKLAEIVFHNALGQQVKSVAIKETGAGSLNVFAADLSTGIYTYTLVIDGNVVDSKKMTKTE